MGMEAILSMWPRCGEPLSLPCPMKAPFLFPIWVYKKPNPWGRAFLPKGYNLNNLNKGPQDKATYQI